MNSHLTVISRHTSTNAAFKAGLFCSVSYFSVNLFLPVQYLNDKVKHVTWKIHF